MKWAGVNSLYVPGLTGDYLNHLNGQRAYIGVF